MRRFLFVAGLAILAWIFVVPGCSDKFGCEAAGGSNALASDGDCPDSLQEAAQDSDWAADRMRAPRGPVWLRVGHRVHRRDRAYPAEGLDNGRMVAAGPPDIYREG
jgi:hypothetical protein